MARIWTEAAAPFARSPLIRMLSGEVTSSHLLLPVSSHCLACVATTADSPAKSPTTKRIASTVWPLAMVSVLAPSFCVALPGAVRRPGQDAFAHQADMHRH